MIDTDELKSCLFEQCVYRDDLWFAVGLTTPESPDESHQNQQNRDGEDEGEREEDRVGAGNEERKKQDDDRDDECKEVNVRPVKHRRQVSHLAQQVSFSAWGKNAEEPSKSSGVGRTSR